MLSKEIMLVLSEKQVQGLIDLDELIAALEQNIGTNVEV
jgi:hypothetical protein